MIQYFEKLQVDPNFDFVSKISATFNVHEKDDKVFCISLDTLTNVDCMLITKFLLNHVAKHQITNIDESKTPSTKNSSTESSDTENSSISYAYISENDSFNDENSRIFDVFDFFEHFISLETNGEISEHLISFETNDANSEHFFFSETNAKNRLSFNDVSATQSIKRRRKRPRKHATKKKFTFVFTSDINFFNNIFINRHLSSNLPYVKSRKKEVTGLINSGVATRSAK